MKTKTPAKLSVARSLIILSLVTLASQGLFAQVMYSITDLGTLGGSGSEAFGINNSGQIVGYSSTAGGNGDAFLYSGGVMSDLGTLGGNASEAYGINNSGQIVGQAVPTAGGNGHAFLYSGGVMSDLGTLSGYSSSEAFGINNSGQIVGYSSNDLPSGVGNAFLYSGGVMSDLNRDIPSGSGWDLEEATAINDSGQIVGYGTNPSGQIDAFLLTPIPEPDSRVLLGMGGVVMLLRLKAAGTKRAPIL